MYTLHPQPYRSRTRQVLGLVQRGHGALFSVNDIEQGTRVRTVGCLCVYDESSRSVRECIRREGGRSARQEDGFRDSECLPPTGSCQNFCVWHESSAIGASFGLLRSSRCCSSPIDQINTTAFTALHLYDLTTLKSTSRRNFRMHQTPGRAAWNDGGWSDHRSLHTAYFSTASSSDCLKALTAFL